MRSREQSPPTLPAVALARTETSTTTRRPCHDAIMGSIHPVEGVIMVGAPKDGRSDRRELREVGALCDWGGCVRPATLERWSAQLREWLPCCDQCEKKED